MRLPDSFSTLTLLLGLLLAAPLMAQAPDAATSAPASAPAATAAAMDEALADHQPSADRTREALTRLLALPQVQELARDRGLDLQQLESATATLSDAQLQEVAPLVATVTPLMQRSMGTVTISVAALIILLLILILVS